MTDYAFLTELEAIIDARLAAPSPDSYTARLAAAGVKRVAQKVGEEGVEVALAAVLDEPSEALSAEAADLVYHLLVLLKLRNLALADVVRTLKARHEN